MINWRVLDVTITAGSLPVASISLGELTGTMAGRTRRRIAARLRISGVRWTPGQKHRDQPRNPTEAPTTTGASTRPCSRASRADSAWRSRPATRSSGVAGTRGAPTHHTINPAIQVPHVVALGDEQLRDLGRGVMLGGHGHHGRVRADVECGLMPSRSGVGIGLGWCNDDLGTVVSRAVAITTTVTVSTPTVAVYASTSLASDGSSTPSLRFSALSVASSEAGVGGGSRCAGVKVIGDGFGDWPSLRAGEAVSELVSRRPSVPVSRPLRPQVPFAIRRPHEQT